jgi:colicin import membrane protein
MTSTATEAATATCKYPGCENEPRAAEDGAGAKPKYCGQPDPLTGKPHGPGTAYRRRLELRQDGTAVDDDMGRPVSMATTRAAELRRGIKVDIAALTGKLAGLVEQLERAGDPESAEAEIEAVQRETRQQVDAAETRAAQEVRRRQDANTEAEEARIVVLEAEERRQAAEDARGQAEQRAAEAQAEAERIREETQARIALIEEDRDSAIEAAEAAKAAAVRAADARAEQAGARAQEAIAQIRAEAEALVRAAGEARDQALAQTAQADQRTAAAEARTEDARAEAARIREDAAREAGQLRADAARERDELRAGLEAQAQILEESRDDMRVRAERAERDLDAARAELTRLRQERAGEG